jgi:hypothetical protein
MYSEATACMRQLLCRHYMQSAQIRPAHPTLYMCMTVRTCALHTYCRSYITFHHYCTHLLYPAHICISDSLHTQPSLILVEYIYGLVVAAARVYMYFVCVVLHHACMYVIFMWKEHACSGGRIMAAGDERMK